MLARELEPGGARLNYRTEYRTIL